MNANQLQKLASELDNGQEEESTDTFSLTEPELYDFIVDFAKSEMLRSLEDEGLSRLLFLNEVIDELLTQNDRTPATQDSALPAQGGDSASTTLEDIVSPAMDSSTPPSPMTETMLLLAMM